MQARSPPTLKLQNISDFSQYKTRSVKNGDGLHKTAWCHSSLGYLPPAPASNQLNVNLAELHLKANFSVQLSKATSLRQLRSIFAFPQVLKCSYR
jgi:hypothetical protein